MDGEQTNKTKTEMTKQVEREKIDITHYSKGDKGMKEIWERSQKCDLYALHLINEIWQTMIRTDHQFSTLFCMFSVVSSVVGVL